MIQPASSPLGEIRCLTGLRGCAAFIVMIYHFSLHLPPNTLGLQDAVRNGYLCVDLFFLLSGFVMAYSQAGRFAAGLTWPACTGFLLARLARIYPLYALITIESACVVAWRTPIGDLAPLGRTLLLNLALIQSWGLAPSLEGAAWSISTEWGAYLAFPLLLAAALSASPKRTLTLAAASALSIAFVAWAPVTATLPGQSRMGPLDVYSAASLLPLIRCIAEFALGLLAFRAARAWTGKLREWAGPAAFGTAAAIALLFARPGTDLLIVALFAILLVSLTPQTGSVANLLARPAPYRLGQWSYSIYLIHDKFSLPLATLRDKLAERMPMAPEAASEIAIVLMSALVVGLGATTYFLVELPLRRLVLRGIGQLSQVRGAPAPATVPVASKGQANALG